MAPCTSCSLVKSSNCRSQYCCDVCTYMFRMDQGSGKNNQCSNHVFKVYAFYQHCSTVYKVPNRHGSTMLCLSNSSISNISHHIFACPHHMGVNNECTFFQGDDDMHNNDESPASKIVDNDSNCLCDTSDSNESLSFLKGTSTYEDSKVFFNGLNGCSFY
jgi:rubredoxin